MKKVIAAAAGLMLAGAMVSTASAAVSLSGDARVRGYVQRDYDAGGIIRTNETDDKIASRVRVKIDAKAKGGASATARIKIGDGTFGATTGADVKTDYAYITVPMGPVAFQGGRIPLDATKFFFWDRTSDALLAKWANDMTSVQAWYIKSIEYTDPATDLSDDEDVNVYAALLTQKFGGDWGMTAAIAYLDDQRPLADSGWAGTINFTGPAGPINFIGEFAYQSSDYIGAADDGYGGYVQGGMNFGATTVALNAGFTSDGYIADDDFGFIMIGGAASITPAFSANVGLYGDWWWIGLPVSFTVSENILLKANLVYADIDKFGSLTEVSGSMIYTISDGANFQWDIGYLGVSLDNDRFEESPYGTAGTFNVSF